MALELVTDAAIEPISYLEVLTHARINPFDEEIDEASVAELDRIIRAVRDDTESFLNRALITQTWRYYLDEWPDLPYIEIPKPPLQSVSSVKYTDSDGTETTWNVPDTGEYIVDILSNRGRIVLGYDKSFPTATLYPSNPIKIEFVCGYGLLAENVKRKIIQAMLIQCVDLYDNPGSFVQGQPIHRLDTVEKLLWPYKVWT